MTLLDVHDLSTELATPAGAVHAVDGVAYGVEVGETPAVVVAMRDQGSRERLRGSEPWRRR